MKIGRVVSRIITAHQQHEGAGFLVRRPVPTMAVDQIDPFLMLDEVGPVTYGPGEAVGAPDHPHRGFETVSYIIAGEKLHEDSLGQTQLIRAGDVQWMTAGAGIIHSEMPSENIQKNGGLAHGFQIWVNLPAAAKFSKPGYQFLARDQIPTATSPDGLIGVTVIAGEAFGVAAAIGTHTPIWLQDWSVEAGARSSVEIPQEFNAAAYVFQGRVCFGAETTSVEQGQMALFGPGSELEVSSENHHAGGRFLLLAGEPIGEPVARYGPFVMNTDAQIRQAINDYQSGRMGNILRE